MKKKNNCGFFIFLTGNYVNLCAVLFLLLIPSILFPQDKSEEILNLGNEAMKNGDYQKAVEYFSDYILLCPDSASVYHSRASAFLLLRKYNESFDDVNKALTLNPLNAGAYTTRAVLYMYMNNTGESIKDFEKSLEIDSFNVNTLNSYAAMIAQTGDFEKALTLINKSLEINPEYAEAYRNRGAIYYYYLKDTLMAFNEIEKAYELAPEKTDNINALGAMYREIGNYIKAIEYYNKALSVDPKNAEAYCRRGISYLYLEEYEKAIQDIEYGLMLNPEYKGQVQKYLDEAKSKLK
ncbi:MAG: tetratricopeptide repeat protein [Ignavibacteria bacterium]|nr:tetratricopeptide repeat protein [Ignavibacteria bacterium]